MEKFKACEKEMKTKAFSKEGLNASAKLDPKLLEKMEMMQWVQDKVEGLQQQVELTEAEIESLQAGGKKKKASNTDRLEKLEHLNERRKWHIGRLEIILRLLDNGSLKADKVKDLQEDVTYFVDSNAVSHLIAPSSHYSLQILSGR
jgi:CCR4-NOT transcription complex subunit 3